MRTWVVLCLAAALGGGACSSGFDGVSAKDGCGDIWASVCTRYYECYRADEIAEIGLPPTAAGCTTQLTDENCDAFTDTACGDGTRYHPSELMTCTSAIVVTDCTLIADAPGTVPACNAVCGN